MLKNLGQRIRTLRKAKGLTLVEISEKTGVAQATLSRIETGTMVGTVECHEKIAETLGIGLAELYSGVDKRYEQIARQDKDPAKSPITPKTCTSNYLPRKAPARKSPSAIDPPEWRQDGKGIQRTGRGKVLVGAGRERQNQAGSGRNRTEVAGIYLL